MVIKCIEKIRNKHNQITHYKLQDDNNNIKIVTASSLKNAIKYNKVEVINLVLTTDNRLVDKDIKQNNLPNKTSIEKIIERAKLLGKLKSIPTFCGNPCHIIEMGTKNYMLYIPDNVKRLNNADFNISFTEELQNINGNLQVVGGRSLENIEAMFLDCMFDKLDLSRFITSNVKDMSDMFRGAYIDIIDISTLDTSKVISTSEMFQSCKAKKIILGNFDTRNVVDMSSMFSGCVVEEPIDINFNTSKVTSMRQMFYNFSVDKLKLKSFDTSDVRDMSYMFAYCRINNLDISNFNTSQLFDMGRMFEGACIKNLELGKFNTSKVTDMSKMFSNATFDALDLSSFDTHNVEDMSGMFEFCAIAHGDLNISKFDTSSVINMDGMFTLTDVRVIDIRNFSGKALKSANAMFAYCASREIRLNDNLFDKLEPINMQNIFYSCTSKVCTNNEWILTIKNSSFCD